MNRQREVHALQVNVEGHGLKEWRQKDMKQAWRLDWHRDPRCDDKWTSQEMRSVPGQREDPYELHQQRVKAPRSKELESEKEAEGILLT